MNGILEVIQKSLGKIKRLIAANTKDRKEITELMIKNY